MKNDFEKRFHRLQHRISIAQAARKNAQGKVTLIAASKTKSTTEIRKVALAGVTNFGENYLQEALKKIQDLQELNLCWHFIGAIQSNKTAAIAEHFDWVHTVDRLKIAQRLSRQRSDNACELNVLIQLNIDNEPQKAGVSVDKLPSLAKDIESLPHLKLRGLMAIPRARSDAAGQDEVFAKVAKCHKQIAAQIGNHFDSLSMGMSNDLETAIKAGATHIRVGSDLFGPRS